jgi:branched-chain amino acid transport system permease protein
LTLFLQQLVNGIALGSVYALVALGLTLVYGVLKVPNFAHGALYTAGAYVAYVMLTGVGAPYVLAVVAAMAVVAALGAAVQWVVFRPLEGKSPVHAMIAALGVLFFLEGTADVIWGPDFRQVPTPFDGVVSLGPINITEQRVLVIVAAIATMSALYWLLKKTMVGMSIEAMARTVKARSWSASTHAGSRSSRSHSRECSPRLPARSSRRSCSSSRRWVPSSC